MNRWCQYGPFLVVVLNSAVITYWIHFIHDFCVSGSTCYVPAIVLSTVTFFSALSSNSPMRNISLALFYPRRNWDSVRTDEFLIHKDVKWQGQNLKLAPKAMLSSLLWDKPSLHLFRHFQVLQWVCRSCVLLSFEKLLPVNYIQHTPKKNLLQLLLQNSASSYYINFPPWTWHQISDIMGGGVRRNIQFTALALVWRNSITHCLDTIQIAVAMDFDFLLNEWHFLSETW